MASYFSTSSLLPLTFTINFQLETDLLFLKEAYNTGESFYVHTVTFNTFCPISKQKEQQEPTEKHREFLKWQNTAQAHRKNMKNSYIPCA